MQKKLIVMFLVVTVLLVGLIGRLMYIEYTSGDKYEKIVLSQQEYDSRIIPYQRGDIVDTKGTILATSVDVYNVILDCKVLNQNKDDIEPTILALTTCFPDLKAEDIRQKLRIIRMSIVMQSGLKKNISGVIHMVRWQPHWLDLCPVAM